LEEQYNAIKKVKAGFKPAKEESPEQAEEVSKAEVSVTKKERKPYPLSDWDKFIIQTIEERGHATLSKEIYESVKQKAIEAGIFTTDDKSKAKINQCLVKLTNRREDLRKVKYKGRGFAYALPDWYDERNRLKKEHKIQ
jgi:hypothetical protein